MNKPEIPKFDLRRAFEEGRAAPFCVEARRKNSRGWIALAQLHEQEVADVHRLCKLVPHGSRNVHVGIDPDSGRVGVFVVTGDEQELDLANGGTAPASAQKRAQESAGIIADRIAGALKVADGVFEKLSAGMELAYEDVFDGLPAEVPPESLRAALCQGQLPEMHLALAEHAGTVGGRSFGARELVTRNPIELIAGVRKVDLDGKPNGTARLNVVSAVDPTKRAIAGLGLGKSLEAQVRTSDNSRALALMNLSAAYERNVRVKIQVSFELATGRMCFVVQDVDAVDLIRQIRPIQMDLLDL